MKYLLLVLTLTLSSNCAAQNFSTLISEIVRLNDLEQYDKVLTIANTAFEKAGSDTKKQIEALYYIGHSQYYLEQNGIADSISTYCISWCQKAQSKNQHPYYTKLLVLNASIKADLEKYEEAHILIDKAIENSEQDSEDMALSLGFGAYIYQQQENMNEAEKYALRSYTLIKQNNWSNIDILEIELIFGSLFQDIGNYTLSIEITEKVIKNRLQKQLYNSNKLSVAYNDLAITYKYLGNFYKGIDYLKKSFEISKKNNKNNKNMLTSLFNIASSYAMNSFEVDSTLYYTDLFKLELNSMTDSNDKNKRTLQVYDLDAIFALNIGAYSTGIKHAEQAIAFIERINGKEKYHHQYIEAMNVIANCYSGMKDFDKAILYTEKALSYLDLSKDKYTENTLYQNLGTIYFGKKEYEKSLYYTEKALLLSEQLFGKTSTTYIYDQEEMGVVLLRLKRIKEGLFYIQNGQKEVLKRQNKFNKRAISYTANLICGYLLLHQKDSVAILLNSLHNALSGIYDNELSKLNEKNRANLVNKYRPNSTLLFSTALDYQQDFTTTAYDHALLTKGIVQSYTQAWKQQLEKTKDKQLKTLYENWLENKFYVSKQYEIEIVQRNPKIDSIEQHAGNLESQLSQQSASFRLANEQVNWQQIQAKLGEKEAAVEFIHFQYRNSFELTDSVMYAAMILKKGDLAPILIPLFEEKALDTLLKANIVYKKDDKSDLYRLIWQPLEKYLGDADKIYYAPSGKLELVSFDALCYERRRFLNDKYSVFRRLRSTRTLYFSLDNAPLRVTKNTRNLLLGDVKYGENDEPKGNHVATMSANNRPFVRLENARRQYNSIDSLTRFYKLKNLNQRQSEANEAYFKRIIAENNESPEIIQFFTHGFYQAKPTFSERCALLAIKDPLYRSGVALANSNVAWLEGKNTQEKEDGLLTAAEISNMDLSNTKVVILTACKSGLGDLEGGEGIQGLQSAFKMANVKTQLVALWNIDALCAEDFSRIFYDKILRGASPYEAFRATQKAVIQLDKYGVNIWGALVLVE